MRTSALYMYLYLLYIRSHHTVQIVITQCGSTVYIGIAMGGPAL